MLAATNSESPCRPALARHGLCLAVGLVALLLPACDTWDGHFTVLGYSTKPNYDMHIHTVFVPVFKNITLYRGLEFDTNMALIREIESRTPYKVVSDRDSADTELVGRILSFNKNLLTYNQLLEVREMETVMTVEVIWRDLHTGEILSQPHPRDIETYPVLPHPPKEFGAPWESKPIVPTPGVPTAPLPFGSPATAPPPEDLPEDIQHPMNGGLALPAPPRPAPPIPVLIQAIGGFIPEEGQNMATAQKQCADRAAVQIVNMMEKGW